jgi:hypothetical protein
MAEPRLCEACKHVRITQPRPFSGAALGDPQTMREEEEWNQHLQKRQQLEVEYYNRTKNARVRTFHYEPWFYAWCAHFSTVEDARTQLGTKVAAYELCDRRNPNLDCLAYEAHAPHADRSGAGARR